MEKNRASKPGIWTLLLGFAFTMLATTVFAITGRYEFIKIYNGPWLGYFTPAEEELGELHFWMAINGYNGEGQDWVIPSQPIKFGSSITAPIIGTVEQYAYFHPNAITNNAFWKNPTVRSIYLPSSIKYIGYQAFADCTNLVEVTGGEGVEIIDSYAFSGCTRLKRIESMEKVRRIGYRAFQNCSALQGVDLPSVDEVGDQAFWSCSSLVFANVSSARVLGASAFHGCRSLKDFVWPPFIGSIPDGVLYNCSSLGSFEIPNSVTNWPSDVLEGCTGLTNLVIGCGRQTIPWSYFGALSSLKTITVRGNGMTDLGQSAFLDVTAEKIRLSGVRSIGKTAIHRAKNLVEVSIAEDSALQDIGDQAFYQCPKLKAINIPESVTNISQNAFSQCSSLAVIELKEGLQSIGSNAFSECPSLTSLEFPFSLKELGIRTFLGCTSLSRVHLKGNVISTLNNQSFYNSLPNLDTVIFEGTGCETLGDSLFFYCQRPSHVIASGIAEIGQYTFSSLTNLQSVDFGDVDCLRNIGSYAFKSCSTLEDLTLPSTVTNVGQHAFEGCTALKEIKLGENVKSVGAAAFQNCKSLTEFFVPRNVMEWGRTPLSGCEGITNLVFDGGIHYFDQYAIRSGTPNLRSLIIRGDGGTVLDGLVIPTTVEYLEVGPGVAEIRGSNFAQNCNKLKEVVLHEGLAQLGRVDSGCCFWGCSALVSVVFPSTLTNVSRSAFYNCKSLSSVVLPEGMTDLEQYAFSGCSSLASVMVPSSMKRIAGSKAAGSAFDGCNDLKTVFVTKGDEERVSEMLTRSGFTMTGVAVEAAQTVDGLRFPVPLSWADSYDGFEAKFGKDLSKAMMMPSGKKDAFGHDMLVWQDYVAGTDPTDETDLFKVMIDIVDGEVKISYWPKLDAAKSALRRYVLMGKESLADSEWKVVDAGNESSFGFFRYSVDMK